MPISAALVRKLSELDPRLRDVLLTLVEEMEAQRRQLEQQVTKTEFNDLKRVVADLVVVVRGLAETQARAEKRIGRLEVAIGQLTEAQKRTEERVGRLEVAIAELAEAQKRTEERVGRLEVAMAELAEAQKRTEKRLEELAEAQQRTEKRLEELAEAQQRTEKRLEELAEAQKRTEKRLEELAEAQQRTEEALQKLTAEHKVTRERLEGLSDTVGYTLEDRAYRSLPDILRSEGIEVEGRLIRTYVRVGKKDRQVNIFGYGRRNGQRVLILGEAKVRPSRREVDRFLRLVKQLEEKEGLPAVPLFVAYDFPPSIEAYVREKGIRPVWSYELAV
ncbi:MAG: hypothetical protein GXO55_05410 [Chloroflexi bacterium]|nr:hypothetical protein [Chloroflexota bacterium]